MGVEVGSDEAHRRERVVADEQHQGSRHRAPADIALRRRIRSLAVQQTQRVGAIRSGTRNRAQIRRLRMDDHDLKLIDLGPLPLESIHKNAFKASEAAHCAGEQGKFWEMHDRLFANQNSIEAPMLAGHAQAIGVDAKKFQACLDSGKYSAEIRKNIAEATKYGITGTPTFVIGLTQPNDPKTIKVLKVIRGAQNVSAFKDALDSLYNEKPQPVEKKAEKS